MRVIPRAGAVRGAVTVPPSKSYTNRALILGAMTEGDTTIRNPLDSDDSRYLLEAIRKIGFEVSGSFSSGINIGERISISAGEAELFVGNAGTAMRFLTGFLAFTPGRFILRGHRRMQERPIGDLVEALRTIGTEVEYLENEGFPPLMIRGRRMRGGFEVKIDGSVSSQFVSALMLAGATLPGGIRIRVEALSSRPYVDITVDILRRFGAKVEDRGDGQYRIVASQLRLTEYFVEGDYSSASYWLGAAAITGGEIALTGLEEHSAQGDREFLALLRQCGCDYEWAGGVLRFRGASRLQGGRFDCNAMPDVVPTLAAIAPFFATPVEITNVAHLRVKESDRIAALARELRKLGATASELPDGLRIEPGYTADPAVVDPHDDHRLAMSFAVAGLRRGNVSVENERVVSKSYPQFWRTFDEIAGSPADARGT